MTMYMQYYNMYCINYWSTGQLSKNLKYYLSRTILLTHLTHNASESYKTILE